jgi:hypothetical protein
MVMNTISMESPETTVMRGIYTVEINPTSCNSCASSRLKILVEFYRSYTIQGKAVRVDLILCVRAKSEAE